MKILVGIATLQPSEAFLRDLKPLIENSKYELEVMWVRGRKLVEAQNEFVSKILSSNHDALLTLEDDHSGHTQDMLDSLVRANQPIVAINYYSRWPSYPTTCMNLSGYPAPKEYRSAKVQHGLQPVDLCGFGFTLIKREVLEALEKPVFRLDSLDGVATDKTFCRRAIEAGFGIYGFFDHDLVHRGISKSNIMEHRKAWLKRRGFVAV